MRAHDGETFAIPMLAFFCAALRRQTWEAVGPLDERFGAGMFEDDDWCRRARAQGWEIRCARDAYVHHWQKATFRKLGEKAYRALYEENRRKYEEKWGGGAAAGAAEAPRADLGKYRAQLAALLESRAEAKAVVFLPSIGWGIHLFQRPHHLARAFARAGWLSIFDCSNAQDRVDGFKEIEPNLFLYRGPAGVLERLPAPLLWSFPYNFHQTRQFPSDAPVVYDWIDDLSVFPYDMKLLETNHDARAVRGRRRRGRGPAAARGGPRAPPGRAVSAERRRVRAVRRSPVEPGRGRERQGRRPAARLRTPGRRLLRSARRVVRLRAASTRPLACGRTGASCSSGRCTTRACRAARCSSARTCAGSARATTTCCPATSPSSTSRPSRSASTRSRRRPRRSSSTSTSPAASPSSRPRCPNAPRSPR